MQQKDKFQLMQLTQSCKFEKPLSQLRLCTSIDEKKQNFKFQEQVLINGIADFVQLFISYSIDPRK